MAERRAFVLAARQHFAAKFIARRTLAVAALSIARVLVAILEPPALGLAHERLRARKLLGVGAAAALLLDNFQALAAFALVTALGTNVILALERLLAGAAARVDLHRAWRLCRLLAARTRPRQTERTLAAVGLVPMAFCLAFVQAASERLIAHFVALPLAIVAVALDRLVAAHARLFALFIARRAFVWLVARPLAHVLAARQLPLTLKAMKDD